tara:strand:- start:303 stop:479 length:177 start_codon:yes stop_codon:yes gene_type:complete
MIYIFYGDMEVTYPIRLKKQQPNYSNGSAMQVERLTPKQYQRESNKLQKILEKRKKKE